MGTGLRPEQQEIIFCGEEGSVDDGRKGREDMGKEKEMREERDEKEYEESKGRKGEGRVEYSFDGLNERLLSMNGNQYKQHGNGWRIGGPT